MEQLKKQKMESRRVTTHTHTHTHTHTVTYINENLYRCIITSSQSDASLIIIIMILDSFYIALFFALTNSMRFTKNIFLNYYMNIKLGWGI